MPRDARRNHVTRGGVARRRGERKERKKSEKPGRKASEREREREKITISYAIRGWPDAASCARSDHRFLPSFPPKLHRVPYKRSSETRVSTFFGKLAKLFPYLLLRPRVRIPLHAFFLPLLSSSLLCTSSLLLSKETSRRAHFSSSWDADPGNLVLGLVSSSLLSFLHDPSLPCTRTLYSLSLSLSLPLPPAHRESCYSRIPVA